MLPQYTPLLIEFGYCHCGCGEKTRISDVSYAPRGLVRGQPLKFISGHNSRFQKFQATEESFWNKVKILSPSECWPWQGYVNEDGYGTVAFRGKRYGSHRLAWILTYGEPGEGILVLHSCDNPPCCNVRHLFSGSQTDNMQDMMRKGRGNKLKGENHSMAKLREDDILAILGLRDEQKMSYPVIAELYNVSQSAIGYIVRGETWKHVKEEYDRRKRE